MSPDPPFPSPGLISIATPCHVLSLSKIGVCLPFRRDTQRVVAQQTTKSMPVAASLQDADYDNQSHCSLSSETVADFMRAETRIPVTNDQVKFLMTDKDFVAVSATVKKSPEDLIAVAIAVPTHAPFIPTSPAYILTNVVVARSHRRKGIGRRIVPEVIRICEEERRLVEILPPTISMSAFHI